jgi:hypothetical protein
MSFEQKRNAERLPLETPIEATASGILAKIVEMSAIGCKIEHKEKLSIGSSVGLKFRWGNETIDIRARMARTQLRSAYPQGMYYESGLKFADSLEEAPEAIRRIVAAIAADELPPDVAPVVEEIVAAESGAPALAGDSHEVEEEKAPAEASAPPEEEQKAPAEASAPPEEEDEEPDLDFTPPDEFEDIDMVAKPPTAAPRLYVECILDPTGQWHRRTVTSAIQPEEGFITLPQDESELDMLCKTYAYADPDTRRLIRISLEIAATK